jgi:hypothetical protein
MQDIREMQKEKISNAKILANNKSTLFLSMEGKQSTMISTTAVISLHGETRQKYLFDVNNVASLILELFLFIEYNGKLLHLDPYLESPLYRIVAAYKRFQRKRISIKVKN